MTENGCWNRGKRGPDRVLGDGPIQDEMDALDLFEIEQRLPLGDGVRLRFPSKRYGRVMAARRFERLTRLPSFEE